MNFMRGSDEQNLDALFRAYHQACGTPEASANFMPELWARIESRQTYTFSFRRMANAFVTAAVALSIALGVYMSVPRATAQFPQTYIEALADANTLDTPEIVGPVTIDLTPR
jgi:ABC-type nitrate/sulfonate/bicarbonate transport system permease component